MSVSADLIHIGLPDLATEVLAAEVFFSGGYRKGLSQFQSAATLRLALEKCEITALA